TGGEGIQFRPRLAHASTSYRWTVVVRLIPTASRGASFRQPPSQRQLPGRLDDADPGKQESPLVLLLRFLQSPRLQPRQLDLQGKVAVGQRGGADGSAALDSERAKRGSQPAGQLDPRPRQQEPRQHGGRRPVPPNRATTQQEARAIGPRSNVPHQVEG